MTKKLSVIFVVSILVLTSASFVISAETDNISGDDSPYSEYGRYFDNYGKREYYYSENFTGIISEEILQTAFGDIGVYLINAPDGISPIQKQRIRPDYDFEYFHEGFVGIKITERVPVGTYNFELLWVNNVTGYGVVLEIELLIYSIESEVYRYCREYWAGEVDKRYTITKDYTGIIHEKTTQMVMGPMNVYLIGAPDGLSAIRTEEYHEENFPYDREIFLGINASSPIPVGTYLIHLLWVNQMTYVGYVTTVILSVFDSINDVTFPSAGFSLSVSGKNVNVLSRAQDMDYVEYQYMAGGLKSKQSSYRYQENGEFEITQFAYLFVNAQPYVSTYSRVVSIGSGLWANVQETNLRTWSHEMVSLGVSSNSPYVSWRAQGLYSGDSAHWDSENNQVNLYFSNEGNYSINLICTSLSTGNSVSIPINVEVKPTSGINSYAKIRLIPIISYIHVISLSEDSLNEVYRMTLSSISTDLIAEFIFLTLSIVDPLFILSIYSIILDVILLIKLNDARTESEMHGITIVISEVVSTLMLVSIDPQKL